MDKFAEAARRAKEAGFDAVQFHGAHGYLIAQFTSPWTNKRTDRYGGDVYGRATFPLEIITRTREKVGRDYPLIFRLSADEYHREGLKIDESKIIAQLVEKAGIDAISVSAGAYDTSEWMVQPMLLPPGCLVPLAVEIKSVVSVPVEAVGRIHTPQLAERILQQGKADLIAMGRPLLADPDLPRKAKEGRDREIRHCISCNVCLQIWGTRESVICLVNPELGREGETEVKSHQPKRVLVLNPGPAGIEVARVAALRGHRVQVWNEKAKLNDRWSWLLKPYIANRLSLLASLDVKVELGKVITRQTVEAENPGVVIAGRGLRAITPSIPGIEAVRTIWANDILDGNTKVAGSIVVLGGGNFGFEVADFLVNKKCRLQVIEEGNSLVHGMEPLTRKGMRRRLVERGVIFYRRAHVTQVEAGLVSVVDEYGTEKSLPFDYLVLALNREPSSELLDLLQGGNYQLIAVGPSQEPLEYAQAFREGTSIGRAI